MGPIAFSRKEIPNVTVAYADDRRHEAGGPPPLGGCREGGCQGIHALHAAKIVKATAAIHDAPLACTAKATASYGRGCALRVRTSPRRVRRVMRENGLLAPHRVGRTEAKPHDGTIITDKVNEMWGTDMTQTITVEEGRANVFVAVEHANSEVVGIHASRSANRFEALEPVRQGVHRCFGALAPGVAHGLKLRHDHGSNYMSGDFQDEIECLGIEASPSFVREPEGNGVAERFIRTLKENLLWVQTFDTIEELRAALVEFATRYNETWLVARHGYRTPAQVRAMPALSERYSRSKVRRLNKLSRVSQNRAAVHAVSRGEDDFLP